MDREKIIQRICDIGLVAVVRAESGDMARRIAEACLEGGVAALEITFTVPGAHRVIESLAGAYPNGEILLGAGTVLDPETARIALLSGAQFIVSPYFDPDTVRLCNRYRAPVMPGVMSVREAVQAMEAGADILKVFPAGLFGPAIVRDLMGPLPQAKLMPTGGVSVGNAKDWIRAGAVALGAGGALVDGAKTGDYGKITRTAREFLAEIAAARAN
ncbi:MAG: bifunctional 2-keto-4-hydroxyglutarate aldolase/2-keto-3-deoxy-6-phosphogluconate aldolase [Christensenellales bacterium]|jgi:2-dehydro-3-deoxyphosphogluconate aldolase/(4S)-4-hydroxy-2-oxoglutarate aldolase